MSRSTDHLRSQLGRVADTAIVPTGLADRARQRAHRDRIRLATAAALIVVLAAAGSVFAIRSLVQTRSLPPATYQMKFGLHTPAGTTQLGPVFVQSAYAQTTVFLVTGDPYAVFRDLATQLRDGGFSANPDPIMCSADPRNPSGLWTCMASGSRLSDRLDFVTMSMTLSTDRGAFEAALTIQTASAPPGPDGSQLVHPGQMFTVPAGRAPVQPEPIRPESATALNGPRDPSGNVGSFFRYAQGSTVVVPPFLPGGCSYQPGFTSLQATHGLPLSAEREYVSQLASQGVHVTQSNATWTELKSGSKVATITVSRGRDDVGYLLLEYCER